MIELPPRRTLPPQVRDKMLVELREGMDSPRHRARTPYAVAAGVAALVAGGVVAVTALHGGDSTDTASGKVTGDKKGVEVEAQRCLDAAKKVGGYPKKADWKVVTHTAFLGLTELAFKVADKPVFCEVATTGVTLTKYETQPAYVPGSKTGAMFAGGSRLVGLVVDPSWHGIDAYEDGTLDSKSNEFPGWKYVDGMALWWPEYPVALTVAPHGQKPAKPLPKAPDSTATVVDRPYRGPAPDRSSPAGKLVAGCIQRDAKIGFPLPEPNTWQTGPMLAGDTDAIVVMRGVRQVTTCTKDGNPSIGLWGGELRVAALPKGNRPAVAVGDLLLVRDHKGWDILCGSVPMNAASMTAVTAEHRTVTAQVANGMFIVQARQRPAIFGDDTNPYAELASVTVKDENGKVLYQGKPSQG